jgi:hypothetical protein
MIVVTKCLLFKSRGTQFDRAIRYLCGELKTLREVLVHSLTSAHRVVPRSRSIDQLTDSDHLSLQHLFVHLLYFAYS